MKSIEDSFEYTQRSDEFEQNHNTPENIMKQVCLFNSCRDWKDGKIAFEEPRKPKQLFFADEDSIPTESQFHPVPYIAHSPEIADNE